MLDKLDIARVLREIAALLQIQGDNPFKVRAYENSAVAVEELREDLGLLVAIGRLTEVRGIGGALAGQIAKLYTTGRSAFLDTGLILVPGLAALEMNGDPHRLDMEPLDAGRDPDVPSRRQLLHVLAGRTVTDLHASVLAALATLDGAMVCDRHGQLLAVGAILRHPRRRSRAAGRRKARARGRPW